MCIYRDDFNLHIGIKQEIDAFNRCDTKILRRFRWVCASARMCVRLGTGFSVYQLSQNEVFANSRCSRIAICYRTIQCLKLKPKFENRDSAQHYISVHCPMPNATIQDISYILLACDTLRDRLWIFTALRTTSTTISAKRKCEWRNREKGSPRILLSVVRPNLRKTHSARAF